MKYAKERGMWVKCYPDKSTAEKAINNYLRVMGYLNDGKVPRRYLPAETKITQDTCGLTDSKIDNLVACGYWHHVTYCEGGDLVNYTSTQREKEVELKELHGKARLVCELAHLLWNWDRAGVYHMDIGLTNILVCGTGDEQRLVPTDFGRMAYDGKELMKRDVFGPMNDIEAREGYGAPERKTVFRRKLVEQGLKMQHFVRGAPIWALGLVVSELFDLRVDPFYVFKNGEEKMHEVEKQKEGREIPQNPTVQQALFQQMGALSDVDTEDSCSAKLQEVAFKMVNNLHANDSLNEGLKAKLKAEQQRVSGIFKDEKQKQYKIKHLVHACLTRGPVQRLRNFKKYIEQTRHLVGKAPSESHVKKRMPDKITDENSSQVANVNIGPE